MVLTGYNVRYYSHTWMLSNQRIFSGLLVITQNVQMLFFLFFTFFIFHVNTLQFLLIIDNLLILYIVMNSRLTNCHGR